jgi:hypothetical protein
MYTKVLSRCKASQRWKWGGMSKQKRSTESYLTSARELAAFVPTLKKYKRRRTLTRWEKGAITRKENVIRYTDHLIPVTKKQARELKEHLFQPEYTVKSGTHRGELRRVKGVQAIQLRNTGKNVTINKVRDDIMVTSNGRTWVYWSLPDTTKSAVRQAGEDAFTNPDSFDIERVVELAKKAFDNPATKGVFLWAESGRVGEGTEDIETFVRWIASDYARYKNTDRWVKGIAILIADVDDRISAKEWASFGTHPTKRWDRKKFRNRRK